MTGNQPKSVWEGTFTVLGVTIRCYTLEDGRRIINKEDADELLERLASDTVETFDNSGMLAFNRWRKGEST